MEVMKFKSLAVGNNARRFDAANIENYHWINSI